MPHSFCLADSAEGRALVGRRRRPTPGCRSWSFPTGQVLHDPTNAEIAMRPGPPVDPEHSDFDLVIVGAGPAGLSAAVYGASEGFSTLVVDEGGIGGQATSSSLIRNYLGFPRGVSGGGWRSRRTSRPGSSARTSRSCSGRPSCARDGDGISRRACPITAACARRAVLLATGASYRRLGVPALEALNGAGVFYGGPASEAPGMAGRDVYVLGGANSAGQAALHLARYADA